MKLSPVTKAQWLKVAKTAAYVAVSAVLGYLITATTDNPELFGVVTPVINLVLVLIKQALTKE